MLISAINAADCGWMSGGLEAIMTRTGAHTNDPLLRFQKQAGTEAKGRPHLCPRCDAALHEIQVEHAGSPTLTLNKCPRGHGLWFDDHELQQLLAMFPPDSGAGKTIEHVERIVWCPIKTLNKRGDKSCPF